jgi:hypothetical protein
MISISLALNLIVFKLADIDSKGVIISSGDHDKPGIIKLFPS